PTLYAIVVDEARTAVPQPRDGPGRMLLGLELVTEVRGERILIEEDHVVLAQPAHRRTPLDHVDRAPVADECPVFVPVAVGRAAHVTVGARGFELVHGIEEWNLQPGVREANSQL